MERQITDQDIRIFLQHNAGRYSSQVTLIQAAVHGLWPGGATPEGAERVVRIALAHTDRTPLLSTALPAGF